MIVAAANHINAVATLQKQISGRLEEHHRRRVVDESQPYLQWPWCTGGTFQEVAQRAWEDYGSLLPMIWQLVVRTGIAAAEGMETMEDFKKEYLTFHTSKAAAANIFETSIMQWSFSSESFWKGFVPMAEVLPIARSIATTRFKEARAACFRWRA